MQSDQTTLNLERAVGASRIEFRSALVSTFEELRGLLRSHKGDIDPHVDGAFTKEFLDLDRFHALAPHAKEDGCDWVRLEAAMKVLGELVELGNDLYRVKIEPGKGMRCAVMRATGRIGRAFSAARAASLAQAGLPGTEEEAENLMSWPFSRWSSAERKLAPSIVIEVAGEDLCAETLVEFLDGGIHLAFLVSGPASPAPLAGLVRPGIHVAQYAEVPKDLKLPEGRPAAIAVFPDAGETTARFVHHPAPVGETGEGIWNRLDVDSLPKELPSKCLGGRSAAQQTEELRLLASLAIEPTKAAPAAAVVEPESEATQAARTSVEASTDPVDRLAAWLLSKRKN